MTTQNQALMQAKQALQNFVDKVERGEARSVRSYAEFKAALQAIAEAAPQDNCNTPFEIATCVAIWLRGALECKSFIWDFDQHEAATATLNSFETLIYGDLDKKATAEAEIMRLHRELAAAKLDAKNGWDRARMHYAAYHELQMQLVHQHDPGEGFIIRDIEFPHMASRKLTKNEKSNRRELTLVAVGLNTGKSTLADAVSKTFVPASVPNPKDPTC